MYQQEPIKRGTSNAREAESDIFALPLSVINVPPADCGRAAIEGLALLIADAVKSNDDRRAADLDLILRLIERMAEPSRN